MTGAELVKNLDMRELFDKERFLKILRSFEKKGRIERIYAGSSFCQEYFLTTDIWSALFEYCKTNNIKISLSVPIASESKLKDVKDRLKILVNDGSEQIDEIIVNDRGMLTFVRDNFDRSVVIGRLFFKEARDGRLCEYLGRKMSFAAFSYPELFSESKLIGAEIDPVSYEIDISTVKKDLIISVNYPYCFMTFGYYCKFASVNKAPEYKFRPSSFCTRECMDIIEIHSDKRRSDNKTLIRAGKAVYFKNNDFQINGREADRILYFPLDEIIESFGERQ